MLLKPFLRPVRRLDGVVGIRGRSKVARFALLPALVFVALGAAAGPTLGRGAFLRFRDMCVTYMGTLGPAQVIGYLLVLAGIIGFIGASVVLLRQFLAYRRLRHAVLASRIDTPPAIARLRDRHRLDFPIVCYQDTDLQAFCLGVRQSSIAVSSGLIAALSEAEMEAVVLHEAAHAASRDPSRMLLLKALAAALFYIPLVHTLRQRYLVRLEIRADHAAVAQAGVQPLASALSKTLRAGSFAAPAAAVAGLNATAERIRHLASPGEMDRTPLLRRTELLANGLLVTGSGALGGGLALAANLFARTVLTCPRI